MFDNDGKSVQPVHARIDKKNAFTIEFVRHLDHSDYLWQAETLNISRKGNLGEGNPDNYTQSKPPVFWIDACPLHRRPFHLGHRMYF